MDKLEVTNGRAYPLGATYDGQGVNFALFSAYAEKVELCLFDATGTKEISRVAITENDNNIWHVYIKDLAPGQVYGYRVYGPYKPEEGKRFNPNKLLLDPYAKKMIGKLIWHKALFGYDTDSPLKDLSFSTLDSAPYMPKAVVISDDFDWDLLFRLIFGSISCLSISSIRSSASCLLSPALEIMRLFLVPCTSLL